MLSIVSTFFGEIRRSNLRVVLLLAVATMCVMIPSYGQTVFNCSSGFSSSGSCGVSFSSNNQAFWVTGSPNGSSPGFSGSSVDLVPTGAVHNANSFDYQTAVNVQAFTATYTFVPNGWNLALVIQNNTVSSQGGTPPGFASGAGCEGGFFQGFPNQTSWPTNIVAINLDSNNYTNIGDSSFTYSNAQLYTSGISPCIPNDGQNPYNPESKISTSPVPLNSPANSINTTTGDTYSVTIIYDGSNVTLNLYDVTAGGSCPGASCFTHTWTNINIPSLVNGDTAYIGFTGGSNQASTTPLLIKSFSYTEGSSTTPTASTPTFSPAAGTYSGSQNVALSTATSGGGICYNTTGSPATNGSTGCASGTRYAGPVTVSSNETLYAVAGAAGYEASTMASSTYVIQPPTATPPIFSPAVGTYASAQTVTVFDATSGATIYYTTNGTTPTTSSAIYSGPITVSATETLEAIAEKTGYTNSTVAAAAYTITPTTAATPTFSLPGGSYGSAQTVSIFDATSGATIYYTTNGTTPTTSSAVNSGPITVSSSATLRAIAAAPGDFNSSVASASYTISNGRHKKR
jgi:hypothetical protein